MNDSPDMMKGTTTVGIIFDGGVVLASEQRASMGYLIANKHAKKIYQIGRRFGMTTAGGVGDAQQLAKIMTIESNLYEIRRNRPMSVRSAAALLSNLLHGNRGYPYGVQLLIGGVDESGPVLFSVDYMGGSSEENRVVATGSGSPMAFGVLEDRYKPGLQKNEAIELAIRALHSAIKRDMGSGEGLSISVITKDGYVELTSEEIEQYNPYS
ncbi:MAG: archaeal proteasome endopeptidase complex subunit beta [Methanomicrobiales archaeon]|jgi:proteasome beta subunit|nr:archaeal proteasome endopeptidase complex subunit beta [Methanomicrobiales archaeon]